MRWRCWFGKHRWIEFRSQLNGLPERVCADCPKHQALWFYSNRTQEWVDV